MGAVPPTRARRVGEKVNALKEEVEAAFDARLARASGARAREAELGARPFDLTLPGRSPPPRGHVHPITRVRDDILDVFRDLGFAIADGPEVELEENNFTKLGFPPDHPATDMQDSFWVGPGRACSARTRATCRSAR